MGTEHELLQDVMLLARAAQIVLQDEVLENVREVEIGPTKVSLLRLLSRQRKQSVNDLARFLGQTKAAASQNVESLVRLGLVRRDQDKLDRRCVWISLTPKGTRILEKAEVLQLEALKRAVAELPKAVLAKISRGMRTLAVTLLEHSEGQNDNCLQCCAYNSAGCVCENDRWRCMYVLRGAKRST